jgi:hypothetical protein
MFSSAEYYSTCKNHENAIKRIEELRKEAYRGIGKFGGYTRYIRRGRKIYVYDGWC